MDDRARQEFERAIVSGGVALLEDSRRLLSVVEKSCRSFPRESAALAAALELGIPEELVRVASRTTAVDELGTAADRSCRRLERECALSRVAARWAVGTWAVALGLGSAILDSAAGRPVPSPGMRPHPSAPSQPEPHLAHSSGQLPADGTPAVGSRIAATVVASLAVVTFSAMITVAALDRPAPAPGTAPGTGVPAGQTLPPAIDLPSTVPAAAAPGLVPAPAPNPLSSAPEGGVPGGLEALQESLIAHVPADLWNTCVGASVAPRGGALAALRCDPNSRSRVWYYLFASERALDATFDREVSRRTLDAGSCGSGPAGFAAQGPYERDGQVVGRALCYINDVGDPWIEWTHRPSLVYSVAVGFGSPDKARLQRDLVEVWRARAGPARLA